jgi:hypothetical protein
VTVDGDIATFTPLGVSKYTGSDCSFSFTIAVCPLTDGLHELSLYAVSDSFADISLPLTFSLNVLGMSSGGAGNPTNAKNVWTWTAEYSNPAAVGIGVTITIIVIVFTGVCGIAFWLRRRASADA